MCSMSSYMNGPWKCGHYACPKDDRCGAVQQNRREAEWLERAIANEPLYEWEDAWLAAYGLSPRPAPTPEAARRACWL